MYVRIARFEGLDPTHIDANAADRKRMMVDARRTRGVPEGAPPQVWTLVETVDRAVEAVDRENGTSVVMMFCKTEENARRADAALNEMSPDDGEGRRSSAEIFEIVIDEHFS